MPGERVRRRIERLLDQIEEAADGRDWQFVSTLAQDVIDLDSSNSDAQAFLEAASKNLSRSGADNSPVDLRDQPEAVPRFATVEQPTSFSGGRYVVDKLLGEGGKKLVYLAHDELLDRDVAFALIKTEGLDEVSRTRISREAQAASALIPTS